MALFALQFSKFSGGRGGGGGGMPPDPSREVPPLAGGLSVTREKSYFYT